MNKLKDTSSVGFAEASTVGFPSGIRKKGHMHRRCLAIKDTPHGNFRATVEAPATADLIVHLTGGNLEIGAIKGNKDIDTQAGNVEISVPNSNDYGTVDAAVKESRWRSLW